MLIQNSASLSSNLEVMMMTFCSIVVAIYVVTVVLLSISFNMRFSSGYGRPRFWDVICHVLLLQHSSDL